MKTILSLVLTLAATVAAVRADITFVQILELGDATLTDADMTVRASGPMVRVDVGNDVTTITDHSKGSVLTVMHEDRVYFEMAAPVKDFASKLPTPAAEKGLMKLTGTGDAMEISGYPCTPYTFEGPSGKVIVWMTKNEPKRADYLKAIAKLDDDLDPFQGALKGLMLPEGFPVRAETTSTDGKQMRMTLKSINNLPVTSDVFVKPAGYKSLTADPEKNK